MGIGRSTAIALAAEEGARVYAVSRNRAELEQLASITPNVVPVVCDLAIEGAIERIVLPSIKEDQVDILINNAGMLINKPFEDITQTDFADVFNINVFAPARLIKTLLPKLKASQFPAHVINISSMGGFQGSAKYPGLSAYSASKAALASLTECLAEEYKATAVKFNCLCLGAVQTEMLTKAFPDYEAPISAEHMALYLASFARQGHRVYNGKVLPVALTNP